LTQSKGLEDHDLIIPSIDEGPDWYGRLHIENASGGRIVFRATRRVSADYLFRKRISESDFPLVLKLLLNTSQKCTAVGVYINWVDDLGSSGEGYIGHSQTVSGECQTLLIGEWVDPRQKIANGIQIDLDGLHSIIDDFIQLEQDARGIDLSTHDFANGATLALRYSEPWSQSLRQDVKSREFHLCLRFPTPQSVDQLIFDVLFLHDLTSILTGRVLRLGKICIDLTLHKFRYSLTVRQARVRWDDYESDLGTLVRTSSKNVVDAFSRILLDRSGLGDFVPPIVHALRKDSYPEDILYWLLPILENLARRKFVDQESESDISLKDEFFNEVDSKFSEKLRAFSRKHLKVVKLKPPSLETVFSSFLDGFCSADIAFPSDLARHLTKRRGEMMHRGSQPASSTESDDLASYVRVACIIGLLNELGVDLRSAQSRLGRISHHYPYEGVYQP
jgi:hypothetical protein